MDERPFDYSVEYNDDKVPPVPAFKPAVRNLITLKDSQNRAKFIDGNNKVVHREACNSAFLTAVYDKLKKLEYSVPGNKPAELGISTLNRHYQHVFKRKNEFKVSIQYFKFDVEGNKRSQDETYLVRVQSNTLGQIKAKLPHNSLNFRYFFHDTKQRIFQEMETDDSEVPYTEKDGTKTIYCQVFMPARS